MSLTTTVKNGFDNTFDFNDNDEKGVLSKGLGIAAQTAWDTVKTKISSEALNLVGIGDGAATWGESFTAAGTANAYEAISGNEMGFMSKMALTQSIAYGVHKFNGPDSEGGSMLKNLGLGGLAAGGLAAGTEVLSKMNAGDGISNAFDQLFEKIGDYADKFLGEDNFLSKTIDKLGFSKNNDIKNEESLGLSKSQSDYFDNFDSESKLKDFISDDKNEEKGRMKKGLTNNMPKLELGNWKKNAVKALFEGLFCYLLNNAQQIQELNMFKKSMLALSLSIAMGSSYVANAQNIAPVQMPIDIQQEITKYSDIIVKLKNKLSEQENYNNILEEKLHNAKDLYTNIDPAHITSQQIDNLNNIISTLSITIDKNTINNLDLSRKINILEGFLENYKNKKIKEIEYVQAKVEKEVVLDVNQESISPEKVLQAETLQKNNDIDETIKKDAVENSSENQAPVKDSATSEIIQKNVVKKEIESEVSEKAIVEGNISENDDKDFITTLGEKIENVVIWFKELFGIQDSMNANEYVSKEEPSEIAIEMEKTKKIELARIKALEEKESNDKKELENKKIEISETPLILENKVIDKDTGVTGVNLNNEIEEETKDSDANSELNEFLSQNEEINTDEVSEKPESVSPLTKDNDEVQNFIDQDKESIIKNDSTQEDKEFEKSSIDEENKIIKEEKNNSLTSEIKGSEVESSISEPIGNVVHQSDDSHDLSSPLLEPILYAVKKGDNLTKIVKNHFGIKSNQDIVNKVQEIASLNGIQAKDLIHIGDVIRIS